MVGVFQLPERAGRIDVVAGVDSDLLTVESSDVGDLGVEMDVGDEWCHDALRLECGGDVLHVLGFAHALGGEAHQLSAGIDDAACLCHAGLSVVGVGSGHRLHTDRFGATYGQVTDVGNGSRSSFHKLDIGK